MLITSGRQRVNINGGLMSIDVRTELGQASGSFPNWIFGAKKLSGLSRNRLQYLCTLSNVW